MKKLLLILGIFCTMSANTKAEIYHGIDIDKIYESSDWSGKDKIKEIIDDYTLLLQYQKELDNCPIGIPEVLGCYDKVAEKVVTNLYLYPEHNYADYKNLKKALSDAYGLKYCHNKYTWPADYMCRIERDSNLANALKKYIQDLIDGIKKEILEYNSSMLEHYK